MSALDMPALDMIVAIAENGVIGAQGRLPWRLPADLRHFRARTLGRAVIMGRATWASLPKALPGRKNIVLTRRLGFAAEGACVAGDAAAALAAAAAHGAEAHPMIIGGAAIYRLFEPQIETIYLTRVHARVAGDVHYQLENDVWEETACEFRKRDDKNPYDISFVTLCRRAVRRRAAPAGAL